MFAKYISIPGLLPRWLLLVVIVIFFGTILGAILVSRKKSDN
ncbi:hypothetical protein CA54_11340 [Symmachiella macrocystis]|uniref:Uncharacterized protein n=1 Tax=Symmachiella macrocystis TaxID=2527985 RepID=A0A5C6BLG6_9PLAN|nr:hypothetical protein CA54_11340 [Symmachiella macrocystis]